MFRVVFSILFLVNLLYSSTQNVELLADRVNKNNDIIEAEGNILVYSENYLISAKKAIYDVHEEVLELFVDVSLIQNAKQSVKSNYMKIDLKKDIGKFEPFFTYSQDDKMWLECESAKSDEKYYITKNSIVSSCNVQNPDWKIGFSEGKLSKNSKFLYLKNAIFYVRDFPIFYLPYFAISTDTTRRTGLLIPTVGHSSGDGFFYEQPLYYAENIWWDFEIAPQIRTNRGIGAYTTLRFVDTKYSTGEIIAGGFKDKASYVEKEALKNERHYGYEIKYENNNLLESVFGKKANDGLSFDFIYLNDIDYLNLKNDNKKSESLVSSRMDYFLTTQKDYFGLYARYHIDTKKLNNDTTLQELPTLHYHRYTQSILLKNLLYSLDLKYHRYSRKKGVEANQFEAYLPLTFYKAFFDDFLHVEVSENLYATYIDYDDGRFSHDKLLKNFHKISLYTDLARPYENFYHSIRLKGDLVVPSFESGEISEDFIGNDKETKKLKVGLEEYFYNKMGKKIIKHNISQSFHFDSDTYRYGNLEHEVNYYLNDKFYLKNDLQYSFENNKFAKIQTALYYDDDKYMFDLIHTRNDEKYKKKEDFITLGASIKYNRYKFFATLDYSSYEDYSTSSWRVGYEHKRRCWNYTIIYKDERSPKLTSSGADVIKRQGIYVAFELYPLGGAEYNFSKEQSMSKENE